LVAKFLESGSKKLTDWLRRNVKPMIRPRTFRKWIKKYSDNSPRLNTRTRHTPKWKIRKVREWEEAKRLNPTLNQTVWCSNNNISQKTFEKWLYPESRAKMEEVARRPNGSRKPMRPAKYADAEEMLFLKTWSSEELRG